MQQMLHRKCSQVAWEPREGGGISALTDPAPPPLPVKTEDLKIYWLEGWPERQGCVQPAVSLGCPQSVPG